MSNKRNYRAAAETAAETIEAAPVAETIEAAPVAETIEAAPVAAPAAAPSVLPVLAPINKGKAAPHMTEVRRLLSGAGGTVAQLCAALGLSDKDARGVIDAIRRKEGYTALPLRDRKFVYLGTDGKGYTAPATE